MRTHPVSRHTERLLFAIAVFQQGMWPSSLRRHQYSERHLDEFFVAVNSSQGTANVLGDFGRPALLDPVRKLQDGGLKGELVFVDPVQQGGEKV